MKFEEKYKLIKQTVQKYVDKYGMFTAEDLISESWLRKQVRGANKAAHVVKATEDSCMNFFKRWYKTGADKKKQDIKIIPMSVLSKNGRMDMCEWQQDNETELLKVDLYKHMSEEERKIVEYRLQGWTYEEIAKKLKKSKNAVYYIHQRMQDRMNGIKEQLLGD
jgi:RNA polymerase sigma factor (sigma-70 family)